MEIATPTGNHALTLENREKCVMTGISEVLSYSPGEIALASDGGRLTVTGENLKITKYNEHDGSLSFTGKVSAIRYDAKKVPVLKRIFK